MPKPVSEITADRTATTSTWKNTDGSITVRSYAAPQFYRPSPSSGWTQIDTKLSAVTGQPGRWRSGANSFQASFGPAGAAGGAEQISLGLTTIGFTPQAVANSSLLPAVFGSKASYQDLWPDATLTEDVTTSAVNEDLVLTGPGAASSYAFGLSGATAQVNGSGGLDLVAGGQSVGEIPPITVSTAEPLKPKAGFPTALHGVVGSASVTTSSDAKLAASGGQLTISVSPAWLDSLPSSAYPVVIDPSWNAPTSYATEAEAFSNQGGVIPATGGSPSDEAAIGLDSNGAQWDGAAYVPFPTPPAPSPGQQAWNATEASFNVECPSANPCYSSNPSVYGESAQPSSYNSVLSGQLLSQASSGGVGTDIYADITPWLSYHSAGSWLGISGTGDTLATNGFAPAQVTFTPNDISVWITYYQEPPAPVLTSSVAGTSALVSGSVVATSTPTFFATSPDGPGPGLSAQYENDICLNSDQSTTPSGVICDPPTSVEYDFKVTTTPLWNAGQTVADSGWIPQPFMTGTCTQSGCPYTITNPTWTVPQGSLSDGVTYYLQVQDTDSNQNPAAAPPLAPNFPALIPPAVPKAPVPFTVKLRLGAGGPSPTDTVGSPPGQTATPSQGAPSPGTSPSSETVNMVTGNLALSVGTPSMKTLAGPAGVTLAYNSTQSSSTSGSGRGLTASFYPDSGSHVYPSNPVGTEVEPAIDVSANPNEPTTPPVGGIQPYTPYLARWSGSITFPTQLGGQPATSWEIGGLSSGGMRIFLDGSTTPVFNDWSGGRSNLSFSASGLSGTHQIEVDDWDSGTSTTVQLWANDVTNSGQPVAVLATSQWLTPLATGLPPGWSIGSATAAWTSATDLGTEVVLHSATGATAAFVDNGDGTYQPPPGDTDFLAEINGQLQLSSSNGYL